jgi:hypothetical protein
MTITFESDKDVIVYALEKIICYARENQYIFLAQSIWWISLILGLQEGLIIHIDYLKLRHRIKGRESNLTAIGDSEFRYIHPSRLIRLRPRFIMRLSITAKLFCNSPNRKGKLLDASTNGKAESQKGE